MLENLTLSTVTITRPTPTKGTSGAEKDTYTTVYSNVPCAVYDASPNWRVIYSQRQITITHQCYFGPSHLINVKRGDVVTWTGRTLMVQGYQDLKGREQVTQVDCLEIGV